MWKFFFNVCLKKCCFLIIYPDITTQKLTKFGTHFHNDILHFCRECPGHLNLTFCSPSTHEGLFLVVPATFPGRQEHLTVCERSSIRFLLQHLWAAMTSHVPPSDKEKKIQKIYILMWININRHCHRLSNAGMSQSDLCPPPTPLLIWSIYIGHQPWLQSTFSLGIKLRCTCFKTKESIQGCSEAQLWHGSDVSAPNVQLTAVESCLKLLCMLSHALL